MVKNPVVIGNDQELAAALDRSEALSGCTDCSEEERELAAIAEPSAGHFPSAVRCADLDRNVTGIRESKPPPRQADIALELWDSSSSDLTPMS